MYIYKWLYYNYIITAGSFNTVVGLGSKSIFKTSTNILKVYNCTLSCYHQQVMLLRTHITQKYANTTSCKIGTLILIPNVYLS